jgi:phosphoglycolate phosphatase
MLQAVMAEVGALPGATLMIGDTTHDLAMAANAGVPGLAVTYGAHPREELLALAPQACIDTPPGLFAWLTEHG